MELENVYSSSLQVDVHSKGKENLKLALNLAFGNNRFAEGFITEESESITLYWHLDKTKNVNPFPLRLTADECAELVFKWLEQKAAYRPKPDTDGSCSKGWYLSNDKAVGWSYIICKISPEWMIHGK